jgi:pimeloyl-ACP methyl ester carboxylesterase
MITKLAYWALDYVYALDRLIRSFVIRKPIIYSSGTPDKPPVVLIPGIYESWLFMEPVAETFNRAGYPVYFVPQMGYHTMDPQRAAQVVRRFIDEHNLKDVLLVAHSKGGLVGKYLLGHHNSDKAVSRMIAISTPFSGSIYAQWWVLGAVQVMSPRSRLIRELASNLLINQDIVSIYGSFDPHIPAGSRIEGATNVELPVMGHFRILSTRELQEALLANAPSK